MTQQPPKKSGGRDISALKERLRPKTGSPSTAPTAATSQPVPPGRAPVPGAGVLPPPGLDIPPPPGVSTAPAAPAVPDASHDPFGHMNAMAQMGAAQRAPEIVIVHDGKPVETVATHHRIATIGKIAAIALVPLVIGVAIRGISKDAHAYNSGIVGAKIVSKEVTDLKRELGALQDKLFGPDGVEKKAADKKDFSGREVTAALRAFDKLEIDPARMFRAKHYNLGALTSAQVLEFYAGVAQLKQMINDHLKLAVSDDAALGKALEETKKLVLPKEQQLATQYRYAVRIWNPTPDDARNDSAPPGARLVEVGPPYCGGDAQPSTSGTCPADKPPTALAVRYAPGGKWEKGDFLSLQGGGDGVASGKIIPMSPNPLFEALALTPEGAASELAYRKRLQNIKDKLTDIMKLANELETPLGKKAREKPHFTFFM